MASAHDVATYILERQGPMSTWKLQKLVYYAQAWHLAWDEEPLFHDAIEAWANGPVVRSLYSRHRGKFNINKWRGGKSDSLTDREREVIDAVLEGYGNLSGRQLSILTHAEAPWREARDGLAPTARSQRHIKPEAMQTFYAALDADENAQPVSAIDWSNIG